MAGKPLRILYVEDSVTDAEIVIRELIRDGFAPSYQLVATEPEYLAGLATLPDLILSDFALPQFDGMKALTLLLERRLEIPFILISGTLGEEAAVASIKQGAADYLMKDRLSRLGSAVERALDEQKRRAERKLAESALRQTEAWLRIVSNCARVGLVVVNREHRYVFANAAFSEIFSLPNSDILGQHFSDALPVGYEEQVRPRLDQAFAGERVEYELRLPTPKGPFCYAVNFEPVIERDVVSSVVIVVMDITARRNTEEQLRQSQKMEAVGQLAGGIAHDFNNLLTVINGYSYMLIQTCSLAGKAQGFVSEISNAGERAADLTRRLLAFGHRQIRSPEKVDLNEVIVETQKLLQRTIGEGIKISLSLEPKLNPIWVDRSEISQILMNLSINARDAMLNEGSLEIRTQNVEIRPGDALGNPCLEPGEYVLLAVSDIGAGMTEEVQQKIFEPFFTTKPVGKGTGLGLAMVHSIVTQSDGGIQVSSTVGKGTTFNIYLPHISDSWSMPRIAVATSQPQGGTETILLVEDDENVRRLALSILTDFGYVVIEAANGQQAMKLLLERRDSIRMMITDMVMPDMGGADLVAQIQNAQLDISVLYISGYIAESETRDSLSSANANFLQKPFQPRAFAKKVREILDSRTYLTGK